MTSKATYRQGEYKFTYHINRSYDYVMCYRCKRETYVLVSNIPDTFLHADMDDNIHMLVESTVSEMIIKLDPTIYSKHIW